MPIYTIKHPGLYLRVNGKLQKVPAGSEMEMSEGRGVALINRGFAEKPIAKKQKKKSKKAKKVESKKED